MEILAPKEVEVGEELTYVVKYKNNGDVRLEHSKLIFEYPDGAIPSDGGEQRITQDLEDIYPGQEETRRFSARLFGKEGDVKQARAQLTWQPKNLNAVYRSETEASTMISSVPLSFELDLPSKAENGQKIDFSLNYFSQASYPFSDLRIGMEFPEGFEMVSANPAPIGNREWQVGVLNKAAGGRIRVQGIMRGELDQTKLFRATIGIWKDGEFTLLKEVVRGLAITKPGLLITQTINGSPAYVAASGDVLHYEISFRNVSERNLENLFLIVNLDGAPLDLASIKLNAGKFQQGDNSLTWGSKDIPALRFLGQGEEGKAEFWVNVKDEWDVVSQQDKNFTIQDRVLLSDAKEEFSTKVKAKLTVEQNGYFENEAFPNSGPLPPQVGRATSYTIIWKAQNLYNDVTNAKVRAVLPQGVELTGDVLPSDASLTFDSQSREIVWDLKDLAAGTGKFTAAPSVAFQVRLIPNDSQRGAVAPLIGEARITGEDAFAGITLQHSDPSIDTSLPDDQANSKGGIVQ